MINRGGINTVKINGEYVHITNLDHQTLCAEWAKRQREISDLYDVNKKANQGWRGIVLSLLGIHLPDRNVIILGGIDSKNESIYPE